MLVRTNTAVSLAYNADKGEVYVNKGAKSKAQFATVNEALVAATKGGLPGSTLTYVNGAKVLVNEAIKHKDLAAYVWQREGYAPGWKYQCWTPKGADAKNAAYVAKKAHTAKPAAEAPKGTAKALPLF